VVNKADQPGAARAVKSLEMMLHLAAPPDPDGHHAAENSAAEIFAHLPSRSGAGWDVGVLTTTATSGAGVAELAAAIDRHRAYLQSSGGWAARERARSRGEIERLLRDRFIAEWTARVPAAEREAVIAAVVARQLDPYAAVERLYRGAVGS